MDLQGFKQAIEKNQQLADDSIRQQQIVDAQLQLQETIVKSFKVLLDYLDNKVTKTAVVNQLQSIGTPDALKVVDAVNDLHTTLKTHENTDLSEITGVMRELLKEAKQIPKETPKIPETKVIDYSKDFAKLTTAIQAVEKVVKEQELVAEAPIIPETKVNVEPPDLKPLQTSIKDVVAAVQDIVIPEAKLDTKPVETLLKKSNKLLQELLEKPVGGGGGGGSTWISVDDNGIPVPIQLDNGAVPITGSITASASTLADFNVNDMEEGTTSYFGYQSLS